MSRPDRNIYQYHHYRKDLRVALMKKAIAAFEKTLADQANSPQGIQYGEVYYPVTIMSSELMVSTPKIHGPMRQRKRLRTGIKKHAVLI